LVFNDLLKHETYLTDAETILNLVQDDPHDAPSLNQTPREVTLNLFQGLYKEEKNESLISNRKPVAELVEANFKLTYEIRYYISRGWRTGHIIHCYGNGGSSSG
jgi:hypothetical protein